MSDPLICPVCRAPLSWGARSVTCPANHTFDIAREGYVNLYRTSRRRANQPGDTREMLQARRAFLEAGWYDTLSDKINAIVQCFIRNETPDGVLNVVDIGCGEGYYLGRLMQALNGSSVKARYKGFGMDIARDGVRYAARRYPDIRWCVANAAQELAFADHSIAVALSVFAPRFGAVLSRIIAPGGLLLIVMPGPAHLKELKQKTMVEERDTSRKADQELEKLTPYFTLAERATLSYPMSLQQPDLQHLFRMTPIYWRSEREAQVRIQQTAQMDVTADFTLLALAPAI